MYKLVITQYIIYYWIY